MNSIKTYKEILNRAETIRAVRHTARTIYDVLSSAPGEQWKQHELQQAITERKTEILGHRPNRRARSGKGNIANEKDMSW